MSLSSGAAPAPEKPQNTSARKLFDVAGIIEYFTQAGAPCTPNFARALIRKLPHRKIGKKFVVHRAVLDDWVARGEKGAR